MNPVFVTALALLVAQSLLLGLLARDRRPCIVPERSAEGCGRPGALRDLVVG